MREELLEPGQGPDDDVAAEATLRPRRLAEFVGQSELKDHLEIVLEAARRRGQAPDHLLFVGPAGPRARPRWPASSPPSSTSTCR